MALILEERDAAGDFAPDGTNWQSQDHENFSFYVNYAAYKR
jgi:hypothetical protein